METCKYNVKFKAALSGGEIILEGKKDYDLPNAWQKLQNHLENTNQEITALGLYTDSGLNFNLPSNGRLVADYFLHKMVNDGVVLKSVRVISDNNNIERFDLPERDLSTFVSEKISNSVTGLLFYDSLGKSYYLPRVTTNPKFARFDKERVLAFNFYRRGAQDMDFDGKFTGELEVFAVIEAIMASKKIEIWVSESNPRNSWVI